MIEIPECAERKSIEAVESSEKSLFSAQSVRNFLAKLRRNQQNTVNESSEFNFNVIERKLSSNWAYKLKDDTTLKTLWPIASREYLFLPEFKVHHGNLESEYEIVNFIASGSFGKVYKVRQRSGSQEVFALKLLEKSKIILDDYVQQLKLEVSIQQAISHHQFIVTSVAHWQNKGCIFQLSELIDQGELFHKIKHFSQKLVQFYVAELAIVIDFLHNAGIIYRDIKSENILLDDNYHIKLIDFGLSKWLKLGQRTYTICGTRSSMAPEILIGNGYSHAVDWYSLGILARRMLTNDEYPHDAPVDEAFEGFDNVDVNSSCKPQTIANVPLDQFHLTSEAKDLLRRLLEDDPKYRLKSIIALKRVAFFHNFNFDDVNHRKISPRNLIGDAI